MWVCFETNFSRPDLVSLKNEFPWWNAYMVSCSQGSVSCFTPAAGSSPVMDVCACSSDCQVCPGMPLSSTCSSLCLQSIRGRGSSAIKSWRRVCSSLQAFWHFPQTRLRDLWVYQIHETLLLRSSSMILAGIVRCTSRVRAPCGCPCGLPQMQGGCFLRCEPKEEFHSILILS